MRSKAAFDQRGRRTVAGELHTKIGRVKGAWPNALRALMDDPAKQPHSESPIAVCFHSRYKNTEYHLR